MFTIFLVSLIVIFLMLLMKAYEVSYQRRSFSAKILSRFDHILAKQYRASLDSYDRGREWTLMFLREELPKQSREAATLLRTVMYDKYRSILPNIRGMRVLRPSREASPFLRDIRDHKEKSGKGRIEDSLE